MYKEEIERVVLTKVQKTLTRIIADIINVDEIDDNLKISLIDDAANLQKLLNFDPRCKEIGDYVKVWNLASVTDVDLNPPIEDQRVMISVDKDTFMVTESKLNREYIPASVPGLGAPEGMVIKQNLQITNIKNGEVFYASSKDLKLVDKDGNETITIAEKFNGIKE